MNILITGGTGFLGRALVKHIMDKKGVRHNVYVLARNEKKLIDMRNEFRCGIICGDVRDYECLQESFSDKRIDIVIHAAALKRIDVCQENPFEAHKTNVEGTINCIKACKEMGIVLCFVSTDKACMPCTTYGATKYLAEQLGRREAEYTNFRGFVVRYGNVLDSTGSVLSIWNEQYEKTGIVLVRDKEMTRFFMSVDDSVNLIMDSISSYEFNREDKGHIFVPKLKSMNIFEMAVYLYGEENVEISQRTHTEKTHEYLDGDMCSSDYVVHPKEFFSETNNT